MHNAPCIAATSVCMYDLDRMASAQNVNVMYLLILVLKNYSVWVKKCIL